MMIDFAQMIEMVPRPGGKNPAKLIGAVIEGLALPVTEPEIASGVWIWTYLDVPEKHWLQVRAKIRDRIEQLLILGIISYGSWGQIPEQMGHPWF